MQTVSCCSAVKTKVSPLVSNPESSLDVAPDAHDAAFLPGRRGNLSRAVTMFETAGKHHRFVLGIVTEMTRKQADIFGQFDRITAVDRAMIGLSCIIALRFSDRGALLSATWG
jgi:hypothetical protein